MSGIRLELTDPAECSTVKEYVEKHLAPTALELNRLVNELMVPGSTSAEANELDMSPAMPSALWSTMDHIMNTGGKHVIFDGAEYFRVPKALLKAKQAKVQLVATVYSSQESDDYWSSEFRLVRDDGMVIGNTHIVTSCRDPYTVTRVLPFGDAPGSISPDKRTYYIEGRSLARRALPVCRRFSLSFIYL